MTMDNFVQEAIVRKDSLHPCTRLLLDFVDGRIIRLCWFLVGEEGAGVAHRNPTDVLHHFRLTGKALLRVSGFAFSFATESSLRGLRYRRVYGG